MRTDWCFLVSGGRWPLMVGVNPCFSFVDEKNPSDQNQLRRAAKYTNSFVKWWRKVVEGRLEPDVEKTKDGKVSPLCGYQYPLVFGVERVPHETRDLFVPHGESSKHIIVLHRHRYHRVEVIDHEGAVLSEDALLRQLETIREDKGASKEADVGLLTSGARDHYAKARHNMIRVSPSVNGPSFRDLDSCLFVLVLEDSSSSSVLERTRSNLHGIDGSNRYFDKHQLIIHADGSMGMCLEHGCNDGMTWLRMIEEVWADVHPDVKSKYSPLTTKEVNSAIRPTRPLEWDLSERKTRKDIQKAADDAVALVDDVDSHYETFADFGREEIKKWKVSPDAAVQMAYQLAYSRVNPQEGNPATYESCSIKNFFHGRTETIRSCTNESAALVQAFKSSSSAEEKRKLLAEACKMHVNVAVGARTFAGPAPGVDRHLLGLKTAALQLGEPMHEIFTHPSFAKGSTWILSTSNVTTPFFDAFAFGAVTGKGYGIGYMTLADKLPLFITSYRSGQQSSTSSKKFGQAVSDALREFQKIQQGLNP